MKASLLLAALGLPTLALAQSSSFTPHAYLGAGVSVYNDSRLSNFDYSRYSTSGGPVLTAGYQFSPRLAVQLSPAVQWGGYSDSYAGYRAVGGGQLATTYDSRARRTRLTVPLLLRVTLTSPASRLRVDGLVGAAWLRSSGSYTSAQTDNNTGIVLQQWKSNYADNSALLTLAPAVRYGLGSHLELALTLPVQYDLRDYYTIDYVPAPSFSDHLRFQPQLSAYYTLGGR